MQSERRYKIDKYLEMARITKTEYKREHFLEMAEHYLETEDQKPETIKSAVIEFADFRGKEYFYEKPVAETYEEYVQYAKKHGYQPASKVLMSRDLKEYFQMVTKNIHRKGKNNRVTYKGYYYD